MENKYPECEKMAAVKDQCQVIGEFLDWLFNEKEFVIAHYDLYEDDRGREKLVCDRKSIEVWLAEFFDIDLNKVNKERCLMLNGLRRKNE